MRIKRRKGRQATDKQKVYNIRQRNKGDIDFEAERIEDDTFEMKQGDRDNNPEDKHTEQPDLTFENVDCIPHFPNNISSCLGTTIRNNDGN